MLQSVIASDGDIFSYYKNQYHKVCKGWYFFESKRLEGQYFPSLRNRPCNPF